MLEENIFFICDFKKQWEEAVTLLKSSGKDLSHIRLACKEGMWSDTGTNKRNSKNNDR